MTAYKAPCQHGRYDEHWIALNGPHVADNACDGGTLLPQSAAARELLTGQKMWWCVVHLLSGVVPLFEGDGHCPMAWSDAADPCRMVEAVLVIPDEKET